MSKECVSGEWAGSRWREVNGAQHGIGIEEVKPRRAQVNKQLVGEWLATRFVFNSPNSGHKRGYAADD